ncbi:hypothetical protein FCV25MIE_13056 [Fagus crenata]
MYLWTEAFHTAVIVINNQPTPLLNHRSMKSYMVLFQLIHLSGPLDVYATSTSRSPFVTNWSLRLIAAVLLQPSRMSFLVHILLHLLLHLMVINPLLSTTLAGLKPKLLLQLIYHHLLLSRVFLLIRKLLLIYEEEYVPVLLIGSFPRSMLSLLIPR